MKCSMMTQENIMVKDHLKYASLSQTSQKHGTIFKPFLCDFIVNFQGQASSIRNLRKS